MTVLSQKTHSGSLNTAMRNTVVAGFMRVMMHTNAQRASC
jgi:hypothetical protein